MGKQYIVTHAQGAAHALDVLAVAVALTCTITALLDGHLKVWPHAIGETDVANDSAVATLVHAAGLHHVAVFEDTLAGAHVVLVAATSFAGSVHTFTLDGTTLTPVELVGKTAPCWAVAWQADPHGDAHQLVLTHLGGTTSVFRLAVAVADAVVGTASTAAPTFSLALTGTITPSELSLPVCVDTAPGLIAVGYQNGSVGTYDAALLKPVYNFGAPAAGTALATARSVRFQPSDGTTPPLLAIARDLAALGTVSLYDTQYGELLGTLTQPLHSATAAPKVAAHDGWVFGIDFNEDGLLLASAGFDGKVRVWNVASREREATLSLSTSDLEGDGAPLDMDKNGCACVRFLAKGARGSGANDGLVVGGFDRGVRWFREAGGL